MDARLYSSPSWCAVRGGHDDDDDDGDDDDGGGGDDITWSTEIRYKQVFL